MIEMQVFVFFELVLNWHPQCGWSGDKICCLELNKLRIIQYKCHSKSNEL